MENDSDIADARPAPTEVSDTLVGELRALANPENVAGMARYGISVEGTLGVPVPEVRALARDARKTLGRDPAALHELAGLLWTSGVHEARIMASLVDEPMLVTVDQMEEWAAELDSWDTCDLLMNNLFRRTQSAWEVAQAWAGREETFVKRAGFVLMATLAVHDKAAPDARFRPLLELVRREASDERNDVKKGVNWALRQIGKRSKELNTAAIEAAERILAEQSDSSSARWIARDALRELRSEKVQSRLA